jgi:transcriptional/translational regulatory protein YebC/TACO1
MFDDKGIIIINNEDGDIDEDTHMEASLEAGAADFMADEDIFEIYTEPDDLYAVSEALEAAGYKLESAEKTKVPQNTVELTNEDDIKFMGLLLEKLEDDDDVMNVYHNWENAN